MMEPVTIKKGFRMQKSSVYAAMLCMLLLFIAAFQGRVAAQSATDAGIPPEKVFLPADYKANAQNFSIVANRQGILYFANFTGILEYDGNRWRTILTQNISKVNTLAVSHNDTIYVGARGELGYLAPDKKRALQFTSLMAYVDRKEVPFPDVLKCFATNEGVYFITAQYLLLWKDNRFSLFRFPSLVQNAFYVNGSLFLAFKDKNQGLQTYRQRQLFKVPGGDHFSDLVQVTAMFADADKRIVVATGNEGLYALNNKGIEKIVTTADAYLVKNLVSGGILLHNGAYALNTTTGGVAVVGKDGKLMQLYNRESGSITDNNVNYLYEDKDNGLWLAMSRGIIGIDLDARLSYFNNSKGISGNVTGIQRFDGRLFIATTDGLFYYDAASTNFRPWVSLQSSCWSLAVIDDLLLIATTYGVFSLSANGEVKKITQSYTLSLHPSAQYPHAVYAGTVNGPVLLTKRGYGFTATKYQDTVDEVNTIAEYQYGIWLDVPGKYLVKMPFDKDQPPTYYTDANGLPGITAHTLNTTSMGILVGTKSGIYQYDAATDRFKPFDLKKINLHEDNNWVDEILEDTHGNLWITAADGTHATMYQKHNNGYLKTRELQPVEEEQIAVMYADSMGKVWMGAADKLIRYNGSSATDIHINPQTFIRSVIVSGDTLEEGLRGATDTAQDAVFNSDKNSVGFRFATPLLGYEGTQFHFYLQGFDRDTIAEWVNEAEKSYPNLPPGYYTFHVRSKDRWGQESKETTYSFTISRPYYLTVWAYIIYVFILVMLFMVVLQVRSARLLKEKERLKALVDERTEEVVLQKEEIEAQSVELSYKNDELEKINGIVKSINAEIHFSSLMQTILEKTRIIRGAEKACMLVYDRAGGNFRFKANYGFNEAALDKIELTPEEAEIRYLSGGEEIYEDIYLVKSLKSVHKDELFTAINKAKSMLIMVLRRNHQKEAYLILENWQKENAFVERDFSLLRNLKEHFIAAFIKTTLLEDIQNTLTNLKDTQEQLIRHEKLASIGQLTKGIVDRILNPLNYINNFSLISGKLADEAIEEISKPELSDDDKEDMQDILSTVKGNMQKVYEHGSSASRIVKGMEKILREKSTEYIETDINLLVETAILQAEQEAKKEYPELEISFATRLETKNEKVAVLPNELKTVISGFLHNAAYALSERKKANKDLKPEIVVETHIAEENLEIKLWDNGKGISEIEKKQLFQPFFTTKPTAKGTGLGLYLSQDIIKEHQGSIVVASEEGKYTEFTITIPKTRKGKSVN